MFNNFLLFFTAIFLSFNAQANIIGADTQNFNPDYGHDDFVTVRSSTTIPAGHLNLTLFTDYVDGSLPIYSGTGSLDKDNALYTHLGFGLGINEWLDIGASFPYIINQSVDDPALRGQYAENGMVEMRFLAKARLSNFVEGGGLAIVGSVGINRVENNPFIGDDPGATINVEAVLDRKIGKLHLSGNAGYRMRSPGDINGQDGSGRDIEPLDDMFILSAGAAYAFNDKTSLMGELWLSFPNGDFGDAVIDRDPEVVEALIGLKHKQSNKLNFHGGLTTGINDGLSTPNFRLYGGLNWMFGPLWGGGPKVPKRVKKAPVLDDQESFYNPGFRAGYMAGYGIGPNAGKGANYGEELDGGYEYPEGFYDGYMAAGSPFPEDAVTKTPYSKCYRTGFQGKLLNGPASGQGLGYGDVLGLGVDCSKGYDRGWRDAPKSKKQKESFYNEGYREGYKAGYGIGPYAGLGENHGKKLNGGYEFPEGFYDGYNDVIGTFPGSDKTRTYGKGYRLGFQGKLGKGPGKGTGPNFGASVNPDQPYPRGWEHGWIDAPDMGGESVEGEPVMVDGLDANAFDEMEVKKEERFRLGNVLFDTNSYKLRQKALPVLDSLARHLQKGSGFRRLVIEGHTDSDGSSMYNERLSLQRAMNVEKYLVDLHGLDGDKIIADGWGERKPVAPNDTAANKQKNRRVEFTINRD